LRWSLVKHKDHAGADIHGLEKIALGLGLWEALHDPSVDATVALLQPLLNEGVDDSIRDRSSSSICLRDNLTDGWILVDYLLKKLLG